MRTFHDFPRSALTAYLISLLSPTVLVGDAEAPSTGGWTNDPNDPTSSYQSYVVLSPGTSQSATGSMGDSRSEWRLPYTLASYGISREQTEVQADNCRAAVVGLARGVISLDNVEWKVLQAEVNSIGGIVRNDSTEPSEFSEVDLVTLWMSKE